MKRFALIAIVALTLGGMLACKAAGPGGSATRPNNGGHNATASGGTIHAGDVTFTYTPMDGEEPETVNLAGDFNGWNNSDPNYAFEKDGGKWTITIELDPGTYKFKICADGQWPQSMQDLEGHFTPAASTYVDDGFGGKNAVIEVE